MPIGIVVVVEVHCDYGHARFFSCLELAGLKIHNGSANDTSEAEGSKIEQSLKIFFNILLFIIHCAMHHRQGPRATA